MTKIIPTGMRGKKIIPVVSFQVSSGVEVRGQQNKKARVEVSEEWELFEKNIPRAASCS